MRQRKAKNMEERLLRLSRLTVEEPAEHRGQWRELFSADGGRHDGKQHDGERETRPLYLEIGCGKGQFILAHGEADPKGCYLAVEGQESVVLRALEKAEAAGTENVLFVNRFIRDIRDWFEPGELDGIFLNFSDPWPKKRHAKRRLTCGEFLARYKEILKPGGFIQIKTDNDGLFAFTMEEIERLELEILEYSDDLHSSEFAAKEIMTEYEEKFHGTGKNIHYVKIG